tara:strand:- start:568 stop:1272 length:705 start_codon:yes stop_codon:yes gene_type:complete
VPNRRIIRHLQLNKGTQFDILKRRGLWLELRTQDPQKIVGWAPLGSVKLTDPGRVHTTAASIAPRKKVRAGVLSNTLGGWLVGNSSSTRSSTATIGIRGLTRGQLNADGREDRQAMARLDRMANPAAANDFARRAGLQARNVPYPPPQDYGGRSSGSSSQPGNSSETLGGPAPQMKVERTDARLFCTYLADSTGRRCLLRDANRGIRVAEPQPEQVVRDARDGATRQRRNGRES